MDTDQKIVRVMVDIETLSTRVDAHILSVGAVGITPDLNLHPEELFYVICEGTQDRHIDLKTVEWWMKQPKEAFPFSSKAGAQLKDSLVWFDSWIRSLSKKYEVEFCGNNVEIWCKGTDFDVAILAHAYNQFNFPVPWKYNAVRDLRTLAKEFPEILKTKEIPSHNALDDAKQQAYWLIEILRRIKNLKESYGAN